VKGMMGFSDWVRNGLNSQYSKQVRFTTYVARMTYSLGVQDEPKEFLGRAIEFVSHFESLRRRIRERIQRSRPSL